MSTEYIAATVPARVLRTSQTTLFHVAMSQFGEALWWTAVASLNGLDDPWVIGQADILIPPTLPTGPPTGILGG